jgi:hypothetical protein
VFVPPLRYASGRRFAPLPHRRSHQIRHLGRKRRPGREPAVRRGESDRDGLHELLTVLLPERPRQEGAHEEAVEGEPNTRRALHRLARPGSTSFARA